MFSIGVADRSDVVSQGVEPYIDHVLGIPRHWDAPAKAGARDRQIAQTGFDKADHLVTPAARGDRIGVRVVMSQQPVLPGGKPKEVILFFEPFDLGPGRRLPFDEFALVIKRLVAHRVPSGKGPEIDLAAALELLPDRLDGAGMAWFGGTDEIVIADAEQPRHLEEARGIAVSQLLRRDPGRTRRLLDFLAVLVGTRQESHPTPVEPHETRQHITRHRRIGMAQMRQIVDVIYRGGDEERPVRGHDNLQTPKYGPGPSAIQSANGGAVFTAPLPRPQRRR